MAGTGKTTRIVQEIEQLVEKGISPDSIVACTFTRKMSAVLRDRCNVFADTLHAICNRVIRENSDLIGYLDNPVFIDEDSEESVIKEIIDANRMKLSLSKARKAVADFVSGIESEEELFLRLYLREMQELNIISFPLAEYYADVILREGAGKWDYVFVDEFQDTTELEYRIVNNLYSKELFVVGDEMQNIYAFRGTTVENMHKSFNKILSQTKTYRCPSRISDVANKVCEIYGTDMRIVPAKEGGSVRFVEKTDTSLEDEVRQLLRIYTPGEIVVLCRTNKAVTVAVETLKAFKVSQISQSAMKNGFYTGLFHAVNTKESMYWDFHVKRLMESLGYKRNEILALELNGHLWPQVKDIPEFLEIMKVLDMSVPFKQKAKAIMPMFERFPGEYARYGVQLAEFLGPIINNQDYLSFYASKNIEDVAQKDCIQVMTVHQAKGIEARAVVINYLSDRTFPLPYADIKEELRLLYVAVTRAKNSLTIIYKPSILSAKLMEVIKDEMLQD